MAEKEKSSLIAYSIKDKKGIIHSSYTRYYKKDAIAALRYNMWDMIWPDLKKQGWKTIKVLITEI